MIRWNMTGRTMRIVSFLGVWWSWFSCVAAAWTSPRVTSTSGNENHYLTTIRSDNGLQKCRRLMTSDTVGGDFADELVEARVDRLLSLVNSSGDSTTSGNTDLIRPLVLSLENETAVSVDPKDLFPPLLGNYDVRHVLPRNPSEKPVGGKWSRGPAQMILRTHRTLQHLLPPQAPDSVAEAVNVIVLSAFLDLIRFQVILRGDTYTLPLAEREEVASERQTPGGLSARTVRADFDPPRIVVGFGRPNRPFAKRRTLLNLRLGPLSSVLLDTPYCDKNIRIGKGSRGSYFVFARCHDKEADEWQASLAQRPTRKRRVLASLGVICGIGVRGALSRDLVYRICGGTLSVVSLLSGAAVAFSTGGIEVDRNTMVFPAEMAQPTNW